MENTSCSISKVDIISDNSDETRYTLKQGKISITLSTFGASIVALELPDRDVKVADCVLGFDSVAEYDRGREHTNFFGATVGRVANRIAGSSFTVDGATT